MEPSRWLYSQATLTSLLGLEGFCLELELSVSLTPSSQDHCPGLVCAL
jgi:hypothetical protein